MLHGKMSEEALDRTMVPTPTTITMLRGVSSDKHSSQLKRYDRKGRGGKERNGKENTRMYKREHFAFTAGNGVLRIDFVF